MTNALTQLLHSRGHHLSGFDQIMLTKVIKEVCASCIVQRASCIWHNARVQGVAERP